MRLKTDARRSAIVSAAWAAFRENGFERTSMSEISARLGGSKATLYSYFKSKEELFFAALDDAVADQAERAFEQLEGPGDLPERLTAFARGYMGLRLGDDVIAVDRMMIAEAERSPLGAQLRAQYILPKRRQMAMLMEREMAAGRLRRADSAVAAAHFLALIESDLLERRLHGEPRMDRADVEAALSAGVDAFLRAYAP
ncbi:TetR/AcrR family transcriptional regulator [Phenylobacterium sp.]|jgi:AcrR family transcriptional regulator|uniref:TetR/AcrR family transcriptional regulator n=1 Tax=Phenylobacterium sp. TaxID=1871053 RepID=UPI002F930E99